MYTSSPAMLWTTASMVIKLAATEAHMSNQRLGPDDSDFLLVTQEGFLQRHRLSAVIAVALLALLALVVAWELFSVGSGGASGPAAPPIVPGGLPGVRTSPSAPPASASTQTPTTSGTSGVPPPIVIERTVTVTATATATEAIVPDVFKLTTAEAMNVLLSVGLVPNQVALIPLAGEATDIVTRQNPAAGSHISPGSTVSIYFFKAS